MLLANTGSLAEKREKTPQAKGPASTEEKWIHEVGWKNLNEGKSVRSTVPSRATSSNLWTSAHTLAPYRVYRDYIRPSVGKGVDHPSAAAQRLIK